MYKIKKANNPMKNGDVLCDYYIETTKEETDINGKKYTRVETVLPLVGTKAEIIAERQTQIDGLQGQIDELNNL